MIIAVRLTMLPDDSSNDDRLFMQRTVEAAIRIGAIAALIIWCFLIAQPFLVPIVWGAIIAVAVFHGYKRLVTWLGGRRVTAARRIPGSAVASPPPYWPPCQCWFCWSCHPSFSASHW